MCKFLSLMYITGNRFCYFNHSSINHSTFIFVSFSKVVGGMGGGKATAHRSSIWSQVIRETYFIKERQREISVIFILNNKSLYELYRGGGGSTVLLELRCRSVRRGLILGAVHVRIIFILTFSLFIW